MAKVFVSYSRNDSRKVKHILGVLKNHGFEFWQDINSIGNGKYWPEEIARGIINCSRFLLLMSTSSISSDNVRDEVQIAYEKKKKKVILRLDDSKLPLKLTTQLIGIQRTDYLSDNWEAEIVSALGGDSSIPVKPNKGSTTKLPVSPPKTRPVKPFSPQKTIAELESIFSANGEYYKDQCDTALIKLNDLRLLVGNHWVNHTFEYQELISRVHFLKKIETISNQIKLFQDTCPPGSAIQRQTIHNELKILLDEMRHKTNQ